VQAAPLPDTRIAYGISIHVPSGPLCVGVEYPVTVNITKVNEVLIDAKKDTWIIYVAPGLAGVRVEAFVKDPSIGTLTPDSQITGWMLGNDARGEATFKFHAAKVGRTQLYFEEAPEGQYLDAREPIKVVNCKYKVTITANYTLSESGVTELGIGTGEGLIDADASGNLNGSATMSWDLHRFSDCMSHQMQVSVPPNVKLSGSIGSEGDSVSIQAAFEPLPITDTASGAGLCAGHGSATASGSRPIQTVDLELPASGGATTKPFSISGGRGSAVISVTPIESK
jgi:hypothetical protein